MPIRDLIVVLAVASGCASNPDPRRRSIEAAARDGHGGWIAVQVRGDAQFSGELIAIDPGRLWLLGVMPRAQLLTIARADVTSARLWAWETEEGRLVGLGVLGTLSTPSHGFFLVLSAPTWVIVTTLLASIESRASILDYPGDAWDKLAIWARFPQGMPAGLRDGDLLPQRRAPAPAGPSQGSNAGADRGSAAGQGSAAAPGRPTGAGGAAGAGSATDPVGPPVPDRGSAADPKP